MWKADGIQVGTGTEYIVATADLGKAITLEITSNVQTGTVTSTATTAVAKKTAPTARSAPTLVSKTYNSVTLTANTAYEFSKDGLAWQTSNVFNGLTANTAHTFYQRVAENADTQASASSAGFSVTTDTVPANALTGTVNISITAPKIGDSLIGLLVSGNNTGALSYHFRPTS